MIGSCYVDSVDILAVEHLLVLDENLSVPDVVLVAVLKRGYLLVVDIGEGTELDFGILRKRAANFSCATPGPDDTKTNAVVGAGNGGVSASVYATRGSGGSCRTGIEKFTAVHEVNASLSALYAGPMIFKPACE